MEDKEVLWIAGIQGIQRVSKNKDAERHDPKQFPGLSVWGWLWKLFLVHPEAAWGRESLFGVFWEFLVVHPRVVTTRVLICDPWQVGFGLFFWCKNGEEPGGSRGKEDFDGTLLGF